jgi:hypothetical protein
MYGLMSMQVEASNCRLHGNRGGGDGAVFATGASSLRLSQCSLINNTAARNGAAIICLFSSKVAEVTVQHTPSQRIAWHALQEC